MVVFLQFTADSFFSTLLVEALIDFTTGLVVFLALIIAIPATSLI